MTLYSVSFFIKRDKHWYVLVIVRIQILSNGLNKGPAFSIGFLPWENDSSRKTLFSDKQFFVTAFLTGLKRPRLTWKKGEVTDLWACTSQDSAAFRSEWEDMFEGCSSCRKSQVRSIHTVHSSELQCSDQHVSVALCDHLPSHESWSGMSSCFPTLVFVVLFSYFYFGLACFHTLIFVLLFSYSCFRTLIFSTVF